MAPATTTSTTPTRSQGGDPVSDAGEVAPGSLEAEGAGVAAAEGEGDSDGDATGVGDVSGDGDSADGEGDADGDSPAGEGVGDPPAGEGVGAAEVDGGGVDVQLEPPIVIFAPVVVTLMVLP